MSQPNQNDRLIPALLVTNLKKTLRFYEKLGFVLKGCHPDSEALTWAEVGRETVTIQFHTEPPHGMPRVPICSGTFYVYVKDVKKLAEQLKGAIEMEWGPEKMDYGVLEFGIRDPDGYVFAFAEYA